MYQEHLGIYQRKESRGTFYNSMTRIDCLLPATLAALVGFAVVSAYGSQTSSLSTTQTARPISVRTYPQASIKTLTAAPLSSIPAIPRTAAPLVNIERVQYFQTVPKGQVLAPLLTFVGAVMSFAAWKIGGEKKKNVHNLALCSTVGEKLPQLYGPTRNMFLGPLSDTAPSHLKGELPGDYGFDVMGLATQPQRLERFRQAEIMNGRWAMLGVLGCVAPELLQKFGGFNFGEAVWFKSGAQVFDSEGLNYLGNPSLIHAQSISLILVTELVLMAGIEAFRVGGGPLGEATNPVYPGKAFDPLGLAKNEIAFAELKVKEVKNGRLAMLAMLGLFMQGLATRKGPVDNLLTHMANPTGENIITFHQKVLEQMTGVALI